MKLYEDKDHNVVFEGENEEESRLLTNLIAGNKDFYKYTESFHNKDNCKIILKPMSNIEIVEEYYRLVILRKISEIKNNVIVKLEEKD